MLSKHRSSDKTILETDGLLFFSVFCRKEIKMGESQCGNGLVMDIIFLVATNCITPSVLLAMYFEAIIARVTSNSHS